MRRSGRWALSIVPIIFQTREELRVCLDNELRQFSSDKELSGNILLAWNYEEFEVNYQCLADEIKIGDYYIRLILEKDDWPQNLVKNPWVHIIHVLLQSNKHQKSTECIQLNTNPDTVFFGLVLNCSMHYIVVCYAGNVSTMINSPWSLCKHWPRSTSDTTRILDNLVIWATYYSSWIV